MRRSFHFNCEFLQMYSFDFRFRYTTGELQICRYHFGCRHRGVRLSQNLRKKCIMSRLVYWGRTELVYIILGLHSFILRHVNARIGDISKIHFSSELFTKLIFLKSCAEMCTFRIYNKQTFVFGERVRKKSILKNRNDFNSRLYITEIWWTLTTQWQKVF